RVVAVAINDFVAAMRIIELARRLNPQIHIIVRTRYQQDMKTLYKLGADEVIPDEFGSSVEIFTRVLRLYQIPHEKLEEIVTELRTEGYEMMRLLYKNWGS